jgi:hypothetical protein
MASVFTTAGKTWSVQKWDSTVATTLGFIGWGTGAGTAAVADTVLFTEASEARVATVQTEPNATTAQQTGTLVANGTKTITNAGVFTASTVGTLVLHADFTGIPLLAADSIAFTFQLSQT